MKFVVIILGFAGWTYGMASFLYNLPLSHNPIMTAITQNGWILFGCGLLAFSLVVSWLGRDWKVASPSGRHISTPNPEAINSTYPSKKR